MISRVAGFARPAAGAARSGGHVKTHSVRTAGMRGVVTRGLCLLAGVVLACRTVRRGRGADAPPRGEPGASTLADLLAFAVVFAAVVIASPVCWIHHLILLAFPIGIGVRALLARADRMV